MDRAFLLKFRVGVFKQQSTKKLLGNGQTRERGRLLYVGEIKGAALICQSLVNFKIDYYMLNLGD